MKIRLHHFLALFFPSPLPHMPSFPPKFAALSSSIIVVLPVCTGVCVCVSMHTQKHRLYRCNFSNPFSVVCMYMISVLTFQYWIANEGLILVGDNFFLSQQLLLTLKGDAFRSPSSSVFSSFSFGIYEPWQFVQATGLSFHSSFFIPWDCFPQWFTYPEWCPKNFYTWDAMMLLVGGKHSRPLRKDFISIQGL